MSKILVDTIDTRSGTTTLTLGSSNAGTIALGSGDVQSNFLHPAFHAQKTDAQQTIDNTTLTKVTFNNEILDSDSKYASDRFTPTISGFYYIYGSWGINTSAEVTQMRCELYKNGSLYQSGRSYNSELSTAAVAAIVQLDSDDYVEIYARQNRGSSAGIQNDEAQTFFGGFRIGT